MANKVRGQIAADFDGGKINLKLSTNAICELEDAANRPITDLLDEISDPQRRRMKSIRLLFWAMMLDERPDATVADASALIDGLRGNVDGVMAAAVNAAFPDPEETAPGK